MDRWQPPALQGAFGNLKDTAYDAVGVAAILWKRHRPTSVVGYTAYTGAGLLGLATICSSLTFVAGLLLALAWGGVFLYSFLVVVSSIVYAVAGTSTLVFSAFVAGAGCIVLTAALGGHIVQMGFERFLAVSKSYKDTWTEEISEAKMQHQKLHKVKPVHSNSSPLDGTSSSTKVHY